jgi:NAD(P) transhydrogenase subunit beta
VVNPAARTDKSSPIFGMPIFNADRAQRVVVVKRVEGERYGLSTHRSTLAIAA